MALCGLQELIFTARRVEGQEACRLGLVDHCVEAGNAMDRALELARDISQVGAICSIVSVDIGQDCELQKAGTPLFCSALGPVQLASIEHAMQCAATT